MARTFDHEKQRYLVCQSRHAGWWRRVTPLDPLTRAANDPYDVDCRAATFFVV